MGVCGIVMGHAGRCKAIAKELEKEGIDVIFSTYDSAYDFLKKDFKTLYSPDILWEEKEDGTPDPYATLLKGAPLIKKFLAQVRKEKAYLKKLQPDVILSDSRYSTLFAGAEKKIPSLFLVNQTKAVLPNVIFKKQVGAFFTWAWSKILKRADSILIPDLPYRYSLCKTSLSTKNEIIKKYKFTGFCSRKYPKDIPPKEKLQKELDVESPFVLASISGPGFSKKAVVPYLERNFKEMKNTYTLLNVADVNKNFDIKNGTFIKKGWLDEIYKYIKAADLVVSRAGLSTLSDLVTFGKKSIIIPMDGQPEQEENARNAKRLGISEIVHQKELKKMDIRKLIRRCLNDKKMEKNVEKLKKMSKENNGVKNVKKEILKAVN
ncbi:MAG: glycosyltransferase [Candidatus Aenigmatarchaeota archaeon]